MTKKAFFLLLIAIFTLSSCWKKIGHLTVAGTRNYNPEQPYVLLAKDVEAKSRKSGDESLNDAIDKAVDDYKGGEYMMNVTIWTDGSKFKVKGDVWGFAADSVKTEDPVKKGMFSK